MNSNSKPRWFAVLGAIGILFVFEQQAVGYSSPPSCPTSCGGWNCVSTGSVNNPGWLTFTNETICVGGSVSAPSLAYTTFNNGQKIQYCNNNCGSYWTNTQSITYTATNWWVPPLPAIFPNAGTFSFTNKVKGITTDSDCPFSTATVIVGTFTVTVSTTTSISQQPTNQTVIAGGIANFSVTANGLLPLSYQWYFNNTHPLVGATSASLTLVYVQPANAGNYSVVVTGAAGSGTATSSNAVLTVTGSTGPPVTDLGLKVRITEPKNNSIIP